MQKVIFSWSWVDAWPEYQLDGKPFWALINPVIWERYVAEYKSGSIEITMDYLLDYV